VSIHTFTPIWKGRPRPWHASILWDKDPRLALALLEGLRAEPGLVIGENEPYTGRLKGDTMWRHGTSRGLAHAIVEIRQDLVTTEEGQAEWAERLGRILRNLSNHGELVPVLRRIAFHGSHSD
jgi:predicted N-formylglutamate amidohydrolase